MKAGFLFGAAAVPAAAAARSRREPDDITGEVAVITGASRGLGLALARELARHSRRLVIGARDAAELEEAAGELSAAGAEVTTVVPRLMRTGSHLNAEFGGRRDAEFTRFSLGASLPLISMDAASAAQQIIEAVRRGRAELILTPLGQLAARGAAIFPGLTSALLHLMHELLPGAPGNGDAAAAPGRVLRPGVNEQLFDWLTALGRTAARQLNQVSGTAGERAAP